MEIKLENISRSFQKTVALKECSLNIKQGGFILINGASGSGKSTLLNIIGGLLTPTSGKLLIDNKSIYELGANQLNNYRKEEIGFIFQSFHLLPYLNIIENIETAFVDKRENRDREIQEYITEAGLLDRVTHYPSELSAGEQQRVALIRALIKRPQLILADEPTGNLDPLNTVALLNMLKRYNRDGGTVIMVSHDETAREFADRVITIERGEIL